MDYYCDVYLKYIRSNSKNSQFKSKSHQEFCKCKHTILSHKDIDISDVDEAFYLHIIERKKKFEQYLVKSEYKLVSDDYHYYPYVTSKLFDNKTMIPWKKFLENVIDDFKDRG